MNDFLRALQDGHHQTAADQFADLAESVISRMERDVQTRTYQDTVDVFAELRSMQEHAAQFGASRLIDETMKTLSTRGAMPDEPSNSARAAKYKRLFAAVKASSPTTDNSLHHSVGHIRD